MTSDSQIEIPERKVSTAFKQLVMEQNFKYEIYLYTGVLFTPPSALRSSGYYFLSASLKSIDVYKSY